MDERKEMTEVESGSIMSVGRLTSDILERPIYNEELTVLEYVDVRHSYTHEHTNYLLNRRANVAAV